MGSELNYGKRGGKELSCTEEGHGWGTYSCLGRQYSSRLLSQLETVCGREANGRATNTTGVLPGRWPYFCRRCEVNRTVVFTGPCDCSSSRVVGLVSAK